MRTDDAELSPLDWPRQIGQGDVFLQTLAQRERYHRRRRLRLAGAAAAFALICAAGVYSAWFRGPARHDASAVASLVSAPRREVLPDGSVVELKDRAEIAVAYDHEFRRVTLRQGEAHFDVVKHQPRPFIVEAGGVEVRAVGTAFSVQLGAKAVEVLVNEGQVAVVPSVTAGTGVEPALAPVYVGAGNRTTVARASANRPILAPVVAAVSADELAERLAWRVPRLQLRATPLAEAIKQVNNYARTQLVLEDANLSAIELSGVLRADNVNALLQLLDTNYGITADARADGSIHLRKAP